MFGTSSKRNTSFWSTQLILDLHSEKLRRLVGSLCLRADLSNPGEARWRLLVKHIDLVAAHAFLSNDDFLTSIDNEVATLIKATIFTILYSLMFIQILELTEFRAKHDRNFTNENSLC